MLKRAAVTGALEGEAYGERQTLCQQLSESLKHRAAEAPSSSAEPKAARYIADTHTHPPTYTHMHMCTLTLALS